MEQSPGLRKTGITTIVIVVAALWTGVALAAAGAAQGQEQGPCADDAAKFCKDVQPGDGHIMKCMKEHENELSPECKARMEKGRMRNK